MRMWMACLLALTELEAQMPMNWWVDKWWYFHTTEFHSAVSCWCIQSQETLRRIRPDPEGRGGLILLQILEKAKL